MAREKKPPTESQRISVHLMDEVRTRSKETGIPLIRIIETAITNYLIQKPVNEKQ